ncbi:MAG TPA: CoA transferase [Sphingomonas sp.]|nr:CoA transferase [Sphingomonas sp.]
MVAAILAAQATGRGQVVEAAQVDGLASLMTLHYALHENGRWIDARAANMIDGGAPFYRCYACADGRHVAVGAIEPQAFQALCEGLNIDGWRYDPYDRSHWGLLAGALSEAFATRTRDEWAAIFAAGPACVTPVLSLTEAPLHPHNRARGTFAGDDNGVQPASVPRFSATPAEAGAEGRFETAEQVLERWG